VNSWAATLGTAAVHEFVTSVSVAGSIKRQGGNSADASNPAAGNQFVAMNTDSSHGVGLVGGNQILRRTHTAVTVAGDSAPWTYTIDETAYMGDWTSATVVPKMPIYADVRAFNGNVTMLDPTSGAVIAGPAQHITFTGYLQETLVAGHLQYTPNYGYFGTDAIDVVAYLGFDSATPFATQNFHGVTCGYTTQSAGITLTQVHTWTNIDTNTLLALNPSVASALVRHESDHSVHAHRASAHADHSDAHQ
jgi:hypothetical protein